MDQTKTNGLDKASAVKVITSTNAPNSETKIGIDLTELKFLGKNRKICKVFTILFSLFLCSCLIFAAVFCALTFHNKKIETNQEVSVVSYERMLKPTANSMRAPISTPFGRVLN